MQRQHRAVHFAQASCLDQRLKYIHTFMHAHLCIHQRTIEVSDAFETTCPAELMNALLFPKGDGAVANDPVNNFTKCCDNK